MADYKKVVEMLGENFASFLELAKKLFIDWKVDPKRLFHMLQNIRKNDLLGLIDGTHEIKEIKKPKPEEVEKFALLVDLGVITVPDDYVHGKQLSSLNQKEFYYFNELIADDNFPNPTRILKPGDKLWVRAFKQKVSGITTSEERMDFLAKQKAIYTGAQGASLVYQQKRDLLIKGYFYCSFDKKENLFEDSDGNHRVPYVDADSRGDFEFGLGRFERVWNDGSCLLCFCDLPVTEVKEK